LFENRRSVARSLVFDSLFCAAALSPPGSARGVAIPHGSRIKGLKEPIGAFLRLKGTGRVRRDGRPVNLVFVLLVPGRRPSSISRFSELAQMFSDRELQNLATVADAAALHADDLRVAAVCCRPASRALYEDTREAQARLDRRQTGSAAVIRADATESYRVRQRTSTSSTRTASRSSGARAGAIARLEGRGSSA
jgi:mannitol/fructose-specific phosphotransferase system IIA component (Ntr-type)